MGTRTKDQIADDIEFVASYRPEKFTKSTLFATIASPWISMPAAILIWFLWFIPILGEWLESESLRILDVLATWLSGLALAFLYGALFAIFSYPVLVIYGLPVHLLLRKFNLRNRGYYISLGALPGLVALPFQIPSYFASDKIYATAFVIYGGLVAYTFWHICVRHRKNV